MIHVIITIVRVIVAAAATTTAAAITATATTTAMPTTHFIVIVEIVIAIHIVIIICVGSIGVIIGVSHFGFIQRCRSSTIPNTTARLEMVQLLIIIIIIIGGCEIGQDIGGDPAIVMIGVPDGDMICYRTAMLIRSLFGIPTGMSW